LRGLGRAADLAYVLQCGIVDLVGDRNGLEVVEGTDVSAHATSVRPTADICGSPVGSVGRHLAAGVPCVVGCGCSSGWGDSGDAEAPARWRFPLRVTRAARYGRG